MLILSRKLGESVQIGDEIVIRVIELRRSRVRIGIDAPSTIRIRRADHAGLATLAGQFAELSADDDLLLASSSEVC